jgi:DNA mismatch repair protein MutL
VAISVACHTSIRAGQTLSLSEMRELVQQLEETQHPRACGHGRPTMLQLTQDELEKQFGRK